MKKLRHLYEIFRQMCFIMSSCKNCQFSSYDCKFGIKITRKELLTSQKTLSPKFTFIKPCLKLSTNNLSFKQHSQWSVLRSKLLHFRQTKERASVPRKTHHCEWSVSVRTWPFHLNGNLQLL